MYRKVLELALQSADHLVALGEDDAAANILQHYIDVHPPNAQVFQRLGRLRLKQGRAPEAARLLERALAMGDARRPPGARAFRTTDATSQGPLAPTAQPDACSAASGLVHAPDRADVTQR